MSQRQEHIRRRIERQDERLDRLERLRMGDYQYHAQQLADRSETERALRKHSTERLRLEINAMKRLNLVRDITIGLLAAILMLFVLTARAGGEDVPADGAILCEEVVS